MIDVGPPPPVDWQDVAFDWVAAREAADACRRLADTVEEVGQWQERATAALLQTWTGSLAAAFDHHARGVRSRLATSVDPLRTQARLLDRAAEAAQEEQALRERQRVEWRDWDLLRRLAEERAA